MFKRKKKKEKKPKVSIEKLREENERLRALAEKKRLLRELKAENYRLKHPTLTKLATVAGKKIQRAPTKIKRRASMPRRTVRKKQVVYQQRPIDILDFI